MGNLIVRSRNFSSDELKEVKSEYTAILRFGSTTSTESITNSKYVIEINKANACKLSGDKRKMKSRFIHGKISTAPFTVLSEKDTENSKLKAFAKKNKYPLIIKRYNSSKGDGIYYIQNYEDYLAFIKNKKDSINNYIVEKYYTYNREYRLHVNRDGCFYACRKMLKKEAEVRWHRHENNSVWILEDNELFQKPKNWNDIVKACINAMKSVNLDVCAVDIKTQSNDNPEFIILETNSAPALGEIGVLKYKEELAKMLK